MERSCARPRSPGPPRRRDFLDVELLEPPPFVPVEWRPRRRRPDRGRRARARLGRPSWCRCRPRCRRRKPASASRSSGSSAASPSRSRRAAGGDRADPGGLATSSRLRAEQRSNASTAGSRLARASVDDLSTLPGAEMAEPRLSSASSMSRRRSRPATSPGGARRAPPARRSPGDPAAGRARTRSRRRDARRPR